MRLNENILYWMNAARFSGGFIVQLNHDQLRELESREFLICYPLGDSWYSCQLTYKGALFIEWLIKLGEKVK